MFLNFSSFQHSNLALWFKVLKQLPSLFLVSYVMNDPIVHTLGYLKTLEFITNETSMPIPRESFFFFFYLSIDRYVRCQ